MEGPKEARAENGEKFLSTSEKKISEQRHVQTERFLDTVWFWPDPDRTGPNLFGQIGSGCGSMIFSRLDTGSKPLCHKDFHLFHNYFQDAFQIFWQSLVIFFPFHNFFGKLLCLGTGTGYWKRIRTQRNLKTGSGSERLHTEEQNKRKSHFHISDFHLLRILFLQFQFKLQNKCNRAPKNVVETWWNLYITQYWMHAHFDWAFMERKPNRQNLQVLWSALNKKVCRLYRR